MHRMSRGQNRKADRAEKAKLSEKFMFFFFYMEEFFSPSSSSFFFSFPEKKKRISRVWIQGGSQSAKWKVDQWNSTPRVLVSSTLYAFIEKSCVLSSNSDGYLNENWERRNFRFRLKRAALHKYIEDNWKISFSRKNDALIQLRFDRFCDFLFFHYHLSNKFN